MRFVKLALFTLAYTCNHQGGLAIAKIPTPSPTPQYFADLHADDDVSVNFIYNGVEVDVTANFTFGTVNHDDNDNFNILDLPCNLPACTDGTMCDDPQCRGCPFNCYKNDPPFCPDKSAKCNSSCRPHERKKKTCSKCIFNGPIVPKKQQCSFGTFQDVTDTILGKSHGHNDTEHYWHQWIRSGKPHWHFSSGLMVDVNDDSILDYVNSMHGTGYDDEESGTSARIQLGEMTMTIDNDENLNAKNQDMYLKDASWRINITDPRGMEEGYVGIIDKHSDLVADLDNDGILDMFIMSGGGSGSTLKYPKSKDNLLLFGEKVMDDNTGHEITIFKGGRKQALESGLEGRTGRGRISYLLDVNGDGLLDIYLTTVRRKDNSLAYGSLFINQGDRTWREDPSMREFSDVMILTDADGDGISNEILMIRGYCFPERKDPNDDEEYGPFPEDILDFCSTRPIGSMAVYKFNDRTQQMVEISTKYTNINAEVTMQPECCAHGNHYAYRFGCAPASIVSGYLDSDGRVDHVVLYARRMEFFFSSDRPVGTLPIDKKYVGLTVTLPESCAIAYSIRLVDLNKSGKKDIIVMCENIATFLVYSQMNRKRKTSWKLRQGCNEHGSMGDLTSYSSFNVTHEDLEDACVHRDKFRYIEDLCESYENGNVKNPEHRGLTLADMNNDGFVDAVVGSRMGYQKFFFFKPSKSSRKNRHVSFRIFGDGKHGVNTYGIGAKLTLLTRNEKNGKTSKSFHEVSSYQHTTDKRGHQDEKIMFGLWRKVVPLKLTVMWPNGIEQVLWLGEFDFASSSMDPTIDIKYHNTLQYFRIRNKQLSNSNEDLCLRDTGRGGQRMINVDLNECNQDMNGNASEHFAFTDMGLIQSRSSPNFCLTQINSGTIKLTRCDKGNSKNNSWHGTRHGRLRWSGSSRVLAVERLEVGVFPKMLDMNMQDGSQMWIMEDVEV